MRSHSDPRQLRGQELIDLGCIALFVGLLAAPFAARLGFYSDDWSLLSQFQGALTHHRFGISTMWRGFEARPMQGLYLGTLYYAFRCDPLGYHLVNTAVLAGAVVSLFRLLRRMALDRAVAFAAVVMLVVLPQLSTVRVWYSTFQIPLSMLFAVWALHAELSFSRNGGIRWLAATTICGLLSIAAYEIFAPLIAAYPIWLFMEARRSARDHSSLGQIIGLVIAAIATVAIGALAKGFVSDRAQRPDLHMYMRGLIRLVTPAYDWRKEGSLNIFATIEVNLWQPLVGMERVAGAAFRGGLNAVPILMGVTIAALTMWRLTAKIDGPAEAGAVRTMLIGIAVFVLGHTPFLINSQIAFAPTGMGNRVLVPMAIGVAIATAGALALAASKLAGANAKRAFATAVSLIVLLGAWRTEQIYDYWAQTSSIERRLLATAAADLRTLPANSTVIIDGVCPYHGPGVVLETWWDATGMLTLALRRPVTADTSTDRMQITPTGLTTTIYGDSTFYRYGPNLYAYDPRRHLLVRLTDGRATEAYFSSAAATRQPCPPGYVAQGELI